ncbi:MAG TPA: enoyl-CoA hydratase-related protein, partial [Actinomycetota bacterium]|nr:enoyl-CoA hydratase-related protein [Actinomycetota bacterium]
MADEVLTERRGRVLLITLNRPDARNAINHELAEGLVRSIEELDGDDGLTAGVLTGAGKGFSSGMDLKAFAERGAPAAVTAFLHHGAAKPLVAAVEGFAVAGGLEVALACDLIVAARGARLGIPEVKRSLVAAGGALLRLPRSLPRTIALELALTGEPIEAERAHELGLV